MYLDKHLKIKLYTLPAFWLLLAVNSITAQTPTPLHFESFTINDGLSQGYVSDIVQDKKGFMWFTTGDGLNRYDGYAFTVFHHDAADTNSIGSDDLACVFEDSKERLWIGTRANGIDLFDRANNQFRHFVHNGNASLRSNFILGIAEDKSGALWVRTRQGIDRIEIKVSAQEEQMFFTHIKIDSSFELMRDKWGAEGLFIDSRNHIFITTPGKITELIYNASDSSCKLTDRFSYNIGDSRFMPAIIEDTYNHALFLNNGTIIKFPDYNFRFPRAVTAYNRGDVRWTVDKSQRLWMADNDRIIQLNTRNGNVQSVISDDPAQKKVIRAPTVFYTDKTGVVWIGSGGHGLIKYDPATQNFHHILRGSNTYQLLEDASGNIITNNFDAFRINEDSFSYRPNFVEAVLAGRKFPAMSFTKDSAENLWFGINGAIVSYNIQSKKETRFDVPFNEFTTQPFPVFCDHMNNIWVGYNRYLVKFNPATKAFNRYEYPTTLISYDYDFLQSMFEDDDVLWLGSINGLFSFDIKTERMTHAYFNRPGDSTSLSNNVVFSFCSDVNEPERFLWLGTKGGGLNRLDKRSGKFTSFGTKNGLANNVVYGILPDYEGNLWLSTNRGLSAFNTETHRFRNFDVSDGLQSNEFNRYAYLRTSEGFMIFGGLNGINYFRPQDIVSLEPPKVILTDFRLFNVSVKAGAAGSPLSKTISATSAIELKYMQNVITLQFAGMDYRKKGSLRYRYRMEGFDKDWIYSGAAHEATYTNLDAGTYQFIVQASFENGTWGTEHTTLSLTIVPPWYRTWWFYIAVTALAAAISYGFYRFRLYQLKKMDSLRNRIARDLHDEVGSSISTIAIYSKIVHEQMGSLTFDNEPLLKKISDFATDIMESMNDIVWNINAKNDAFENIINRMREHAFQLLEAKGYEIHFQFDEQLLRSQLGMEKRREFYLIYKEALNNIAKYAAGQNVWISMLLKNNLVTLSIKDDGKGFDQATVRKGGNGLINMEHRATVLHAKLKIVSAPGKGTEIILSFLS